MNSTANIIETLRSEKNALQKEYPILRLGVFGSAVRQQLNQDSDIDIVVELASKDLFHLIGIKQDLEAKLLRRVDIIRFRERMNPFLKRVIEREAIYV